MPIYEYECLQCGKRTEALQRMGEGPIAACPACGGEVKKLISSPAFQFKGSGWYVTDYGGKKGGGGSEGKSEGKSESKSEGASESKSESGSQSKSEGKSESKSEKPAASESKSSGGSGSSSSGSSGGSE
ncbi:MAG TPA: FmdB family zinc ribbon protein [Thermoanaerobaculia bacterium]|jgi:putative FmdB family regulatory protein|nr:FmdB family zinc ribbon protein [Thermoanaerobaculia bacterium]